MYSASYPIDLQSEEQNRKVGIIISTVLHVLLLLIFWTAPMITPPEEPSSFSGILVSLGNPDQGDGDVLPDTQNEKKEVEKKQEDKVQPTKEEKKSPPHAKPVKTPKTKPAITPVKKTMTSNLEEKIKVTQTKEDAKKQQLEAENSLKKKQEEIEKQQQEAKELMEQQEAERRAEEKRQKQAAAAKRKADEAARKKAEFDAKKKQFGDVIAKGKGKTGSAGNQGDPDGDPNANLLKAMTTGKGTAGEGLGDRGILFEPIIKDNTQKTGRVAVKLCVDQSGKVSSARYTQKGSTTTNALLIEIAELNVMKYIFTKSAIEEQCGAITIDFRLK